MAARSLVLAVASTLTVAGGAALVRPPAAAVRAPAAVVRYTAPLAGPLSVVRPFVRPPTRFSAGHRGVDLRADEGASVLAAADGTVTYAGPVAGRGVVVVVHPDGVSTEYEPVHPLVRVGRAVRRGAVIATVAGQHPGCPAVCLHWGARRAGDYLDPLTLLRPLGPVVLLPWSDSG
jgi:murein DD-endopeptidase MepM/ murein hydrolase activator NlpD